MDIEQPTTLERDVGRLEGKVSALEVDMVSVKSHLITLSTKLNAMDKRITVFCIAIILILLGTGFKEQLAAVLPFV